MLSEAEVVTGKIVRQDRDRPTLLCGEYPAHIGTVGN
jgi:hypothetical protein